MHTAAIYIKTDPEVKLKAQKLAGEIGVSLSSLMNSWLRSFIKTKTVTFSANNEIPNEYFKGLMKQAKEDLKAGKASPTFDNAEDAIAWLHRDK